MAVCAQCRQSVRGRSLMILAVRRRKESIMGKKKQMRSEVKGNVKNSIGRIAFAALAVLLQIGWILVLMIKLYQYSSVISLLTGLFALVVALRIYGKHTNAAFKMPWIIVILAFPVFGLCIYGLFGVLPLVQQIPKVDRHDLITPYKAGEPGSRCTVLTPVP